MRKLLTALLIALPMLVSGQRLFTAPIQFGNGPITGAPSERGTRFYVDTVTNRTYTWNPGLGWVKLGQGVDIIVGSIPPAYTPQKGQSDFALNAIDSLYHYSGGVWKCINCPTAGTAYTNENAQDAVFNAIVAGAGISLVYNDGANTFTITNTGVITEVDGSVTNELNTAFGVSGGNLNITDPGGTLSVPVTTIAPDQSTTNEIQTLSYSTPNLSLSLGGGTVNLGPIIAVSGADSTWRKTTGTNLYRYRRITDTIERTAPAIAPFWDAGGAVYNVEAFGIHPDGGVADQTELFQDMLDSISVWDKGGHVVFPAGKFRFDEKIIWPVFYTGVSLAPRIGSWKWTGAGAHGTGNNFTPEGGTIIYLGYSNALDTFSRVAFVGSGNIEISGITFQTPDDVVDNPTSFFRFTLATSHIHHCAFVGRQIETPSLNQEDVIELGGSTFGEEFSEDESNAFQGYGTVIAENTFNRIQAGVVFNSLANAVVVRDNWFAHGCGGLSAFRDMPEVQVASNMFANNSFEATSYKYGFWFRSTAQAAFSGNNFYDHTPTSRYDYYFEDASAYHNILAGFSTHAVDGIPQVGGENKDKVNFYAISQNDTTKIQTDFQIDEDSDIILTKQGPMVYSGPASAEYYSSRTYSGSNLIEFYYNDGSDEKAMLHLRNPGGNIVYLHSPEATNGLYMDNVLYSPRDSALRMKQGADIYWSDGASPANGPAASLTSAAAGVIRTQNGNGSDATHAAAEFRASGTGADGIPSGTTAQEPAAFTGGFRYNSTTGTYRGVIGGVWTDFFAGTVTNIYNSNGTFGPNRIGILTDSFSIEGPGGALVARFNYSNTDKRLSVIGSGHFYKNATVNQGNVILAGSTPALSFHGATRFAIASNYQASDVLNIVGGASAGASPTVPLIAFKADGSQVASLTTQLYLENGRVNAGGFGSSFGALAAPAGVSMFMNIGGERWRVQSNSGLAYYDFYSPPSGSNRNFGFAAGYFGPGDFNFFRSTTAGGTPTTLIYNVDINGNFGFGVNDQTASLDIGGDVRLRTVSGTATSILGRTAGGIVATIGAGTGIGISGGNITNTSPDQTVSITGAGGNVVTGTYPSFTITGSGGTLTGSGTANYVPRWPSATVLANSNIQDDGSKTGISQAPEVGKALAVTGASKFSGVMNMFGGADPSAAYIGLNNPGNTNTAREFRLTAGVNGATNNGFSIYDTHAAATRLTITNAGGVEVAGALKIGDLTGITETQVLGGDGSGNVGALALSGATISAGTLTITADGDGSSTNEIQQIDTFTIVSNVLRASLSSDGVPFKSVNLAPYLDNTDAQNLGLTGQSLSITGGTGVTLPVIALSSGAGISISSTAGDFTVTNTGDTDASNDAPVNANYLLVGSANGTLTNDRLLIDGNNINTDDAGANNNFTIESGTEAVRWTADISPSAIAAQANDYDPTGWGTTMTGSASVINISLTGDQLLTGLAGGGDGRFAILNNLDSGDTLTIKHNNGSSTGANRFQIVTDLDLPPGTSAVFQYSSVKAGWLLLGHSVRSTTGSTVYTAGQNVSIATTVISALQADVYIPSDISPTALSATTNNYSPTGLSTATVIRQDVSTTCNLTGLAGGADGRIILFYNISTTNSLNLIHESGLSTAGNRFTLGGANTSIRPGGAAFFQYDATSSRWRLTGSSSFAQSNLVYEYTTAQTNTALTIPVGAKSATITVVGGGGGGAAGSKQGPGVIALGGGGGAAGNVARVVYPIAGDAITMYVTVGSGGGGGSAVSTNSTTGTSGSNGTFSTVRIEGTTDVEGIIYADGGQGGFGSGGGFAAAIGDFTGVAGMSADASGFGSSTGTPSNRPTPGPGAAGAGVTAGNAAGTGAAGGSGFLNLQPGGAANGGAALTVSRNRESGGGGGGGNSALTGTATTGGVGARGGGGGGGGAMRNAGTATGAGGAGGVGYVKIIFEF